MLLVTDNFILSTVEAEVKITDNSVKRVWNYSYTSLDEEMLSDATQIIIRDKHSQIKNSNYEYNEYGIVDFYMTVDMDIMTTDIMLEKVYESGGEEKLLEFLGNISETDNKKSLEVFKSGIEDVKGMKAKLNIDNHDDMFENFYTLLKTSIGEFNSSHKDGLKYVKTRVHEVDDEMDLVRVDSFEISGRYGTSQPIVQLFFAPKGLIDEATMDIINVSQELILNAKDWLVRLIAADRYNSFIGKDNYKTFEIPKKDGGKRKIYAPEMNIKRSTSVLNNVLYYILEKRITKYEVDKNLIAYREKRSILHNVKPHANNKKVIKMDIENYFPSCKIMYFDKLFRSIIVDTITKDKVKLEIHVESFYNMVRPVIERTIFGDNGGLFIGSVPSGTLSNLLMIPFIRYINNILNKKFGEGVVTFTMYADDMTFSIIDDRADELNIKYLEYIVNEAFEKLGYSNDFSIKDSKTKVMKDQRRRITGLRINHLNKVTIDRKEYYKFRNILFLIDKGTISPFDIDGEDPLAYFSKIRYYMDNDTQGKFLKVKDKYSDAYNKLDKAARTLMS